MERIRSLSRGLTPHRICAGRGVDLISTHSRAAPFGGHSRAPLWLGTPGTSSTHPSATRSCGGQARRPLPAAAAPPPVPAAVEGWCRQDRASSAVGDAGEPWEVTRRRQRRRGRGRGRRAGVGCRVEGGGVTACQSSSRAVAAAAAAAESADAECRWGEVQSEAGRAWQTLPPRPPPRSRPSFLALIGIT